MSNTNGKRATKHQSDPLKDAGEYEFALQAIEESGEVYPQFGQAQKNPTADQFTKLSQVCRDLLDAIGEDFTREGLQDTPRRFANSWIEFVNYEPGTMDTTFKAEYSGQMVLLKGVRVWSMCEHHLLPFWCDITIGYIADERVIGLSKLARIAKFHAHRLQLQEKLVHDIATHVSDIVRSYDVAVLATGEHLCMSMRGVEASALMQSTTFLGDFHTEPRLQDQFLRMAGL